MSASAQGTGRTSTYYWDCYLHTQLDRLNFHLYIPKMRGEEALRNSEGSGLNTEFLMFGGISRPNRNTLLSRLIRKICQNVYLVETVSGLYSA